MTRAVFLAILCIKTGASGALHTSKTSATPRTPSYNERRCEPCAEGVLGFLVKKKLHVKKYAWFRSCRARSSIKGAHRQSITAPSLPFIQSGTTATRLRNGSAAADRPKRAGVRPAVHLNRWTRMAPALALALASRPEPAAGCVDMAGR